MRQISRPQTNAIKSGSGQICLIVDSYYKIPIKTLIALIFVFSNLFTIANSTSELIPHNINIDDKLGKIKGVIIDFGTTKPMEYANIAVYNRIDSSLVSGGITNQNGEFEVKGITFGDYYLEANFIGFQKTRVANIKLDKESPLFDSGNIKLNPSTLALESIDVVADKSSIEYKLDKKVVNVSQVLNAAGGTAVDVLENTPSVQVDIEGNVSLRGSSNFTVLIDGKPSVLSGADALRQIPASALENIEIITNPSAKYEPDGMAGIINLVMKKNVMQGINGIVNASVGTGNKYRSDITLNYRTEKYNLFVGADWRDETSYGDVISKRESYSGDTINYIDMEGNRDFIRAGHNFKSGIDLFLSDKTTATISGQIGKSKGNREGGGNTHTYTSPYTEDIYSVNEETSERENDFYNVNLNLQHNFKTKGHKIEALLYYSNHDELSISEESDIFSDEEYNITDTYQDRVRTSETEKESEFRFKTDYSLPFSDKGKLEAGLQSQIDNEFEGNTFADYDQETDTWIINDLFTSSTDFKRAIHAVYSTYSNKLGELEYMGGLRGEYTNREVANSDVSTTYALTRFDLFPTLHLSYGIKENNQLMASYSRRIKRPRGYELDPVPSYRNRYSIRIGNPELEPEYTNSYELGFMKRFGESYVSFETFRRVTDNKIRRIETLGEDGIYYQTVDNFNEDYSTGVEIMGNINITKWLLVNASTTVFKYRLTGEINDEPIDRKSTNWSARMNTTLKFSPASRLQIMGNYRAPSISAQGESKAMFYTNISYRQDFMKKKLTATLSIRDPLGTAKYERETFGEDFKSSFRWKREPQVVMLTLSYKINNFKSDKNGNNRGGGGEMNMGGEM